MEDTEVLEEAKHLLYQEAISHASKMDGYTLVTIKGIIKTRYEHLFGQNPKFTNYLRTWGEARVVKKLQGRKAKSCNRGSNSMFMGHAQDCTRTPTVYTSPIPTQSELQEMCSG